jgi:dynein light intermediate chain 2
MSQPPTKSIWDLAIQQSKEKRENVVATSSDKDSLERTLLILGSKRCGKTTLIHRLLDSQDSAKPTLALEYTFGRKTNNTLAKV